jgi:phosphohistidine phosphatase
MNIYLLRHAVARDLEPGDREDADRPLTAEGREKTAMAAGAIECMEIAFDLILSSPYLRTRQTAEIIEERIECGRLEFTEALAPGGSFQALVQLLQRWKPAPENVLLVGHEPFLSGFISLLVAGPSGFGVRMKKGALCKLTVTSLRHGRSAELQWLLTAKQMCLFSSGRGRKKSNS